jgi:hypothetical protein
MATKAKTPQKKVVATKKVSPAKKAAPASKAPAKKAVPAAKKTAAKPAAKKPAAAGPIQLRPIKEVLSKTALLAKIAEVSELELKDARKFYAAFESIIVASLNKSGAGQFVLPGLCKINTNKVAAKKYPAIKAGTLVRNPGTGDMIPSKGRAAYTKPAYVQVKVRPLKKLKDAAA